MITMDKTFLHSNSQLSVRISSNLNSMWQDEALFVGRVEIYVDHCHPSCLTCSGATNSDCNTCYAATAP